MVRVSRATNIEALRTVSIVASGLKVDGQGNEGVAILQRMDSDAPMIVEGEKESEPAAGVSRTYSGDRKVIIRRQDGSYGDDVPILSR